MHRERGKLLVAAGANVNATNEQPADRFTARRCWGWTKYVQFLADSGADLEAKDRGGLRALEVALGKNSGTGRGGLSAAEPHPPGRRPRVFLMARREIARFSAAPAANFVSWAYNPPLHTLARH